MISEQEFTTQWQPRTGEGGDLLNFEELAGIAMERIWTITSSPEDNNWYAIPGVHAVDRLGYVITERAWDQSTPQAIYFEDDLEDELDEEAL
ncbi:MAG: hypothetical protein ACREO4_08970 [Lysobacter sp.]